MYMDTWFYIKAWLIIKNSLPLQDQLQLSESEVNFIFRVSSLLLSQLESMPYDSYIFPAFLNVQLNI